MQAYPHQFDCAWLAMDSVGKLGVFITAGSGPIPEMVLKNDVPVLEIETALLKLPCVCSAVLTTTVPRPDSYIELAERGLFVFDWRNAHRTITQEKSGYDLVALPTQPIKADNMSPNLNGIADGITFDRLSFGQEKMVDVQSVMPCCFSPAT
jgi:hypothetical protein